MPRAMLACWRAALLSAVYTYWIWMAFREMRGADAHSNYCLPFHPLRLLSIVYGGPKYHTYVAHTAGRVDAVT